MHKQTKRTDAKNQHFAAEFQRCDLWVGGEISAANAKIGLNLLVGSGLPTQPICIHNKGQEKSSHLVINSSECGTTICLH